MYRVLKSIVQKNGRSSAVSRTVTAKGTVDEEGRKVLSEGLMPIDIAPRSRAEAEKVGVEGGQGRSWSDKDQ